MTKPLDDFKNFIYTQYFSDGIKVTLGVLLPSLIFFQLDRLEIGITLSLGALCVSIADSPGPWLHRKNGMIYTNLFIFLTAIITALLNTHDFLLAIEIFVLSFIFSMFNVYGSRAASVGTAALLVMILNINPDKSSLKLLEHGYLIMAGGVWYFLLSTLFSTLRPYRYAQQTLGECIEEISKYMRLRSRFYDVDFDINENFRDLVKQQVKVNEQLDNTREALFKTRKLLNESTNAGRLMIMIFVDMVDLFEQTMATQNDYETIRKKFGHLDILPAYADIIECLATEINYIGFCLVHQEKPQRQSITIHDLDALKAKVDALEQAGESVFILKRILINLRNIFSRTNDILKYFEKQTQDLKSDATPLELSRFVNHQKFDLRLFRDNLNLKSSVFKFSLRLAIVSIIGFYVGKLFALGHHSYWILLTILVIMKPGFSGTKQRNYERVLGTVIGGVIGALILMWVHDETIKFLLLLFFMIMTYSFIRIQYLVSVIFMTPFILILFSFINVNTATTIAGERIIDTLIGSILAIVFSYFILPDWESAQLKNHFSKMIKANLSYLEHIVMRQSLLPINETEYKLARKEVYVTSANLAAAFQRMMNEPKNKQQSMDEILKFVVLNHTLSSYLANLSTSFKDGGFAIDNQQLKLIRKSRFYLEEAFKKVNANEGSTNNKLHIHLSDQPADRHITEQLELIHKISFEINKIAQQLAA